MAVSFHQNPYAYAESQIEIIQRQIDVKKVELAQLINQQKEIQKEYVCTHMHPNHVSAIRGVMGKRGGMKYQCEICNKNI